MGTIKEELFGTLKDGKKAHIFTLSNKAGMILRVSDYGATVVSIISPKLTDGTKDMVLGFDDVSGYEDTGLYLGATIGRYAGQIKDGTFTLNGKKYELYVNDHTNTLHGGKEGFNKRLFNYHIKEDCNQVIFSYLSPDGEEGFPGNLLVYVSYILTQDNEIIIRFKAQCDKDTVLNMTNHCYYNLDGHDSGSILKHKLMINASEYLMVGDDCSPDGQISKVNSTPMDFRVKHEIGSFINEPHRQLEICNGYDHNWNIDGYGNGMRLCAQLSGMDDLRTLKVFSDLPGIQMYSGNYLNGSETGKGGVKYSYRGAVCLEPQFYPNALSFAAFPSPILKNGEIYDHSIVLKFIYGCD